MDGADRLVYCAAVQRLKDLVALSTRDRLRLAAGLLAAAGLASVAFATRRQITVVVDGSPRIVTTHARTVRGSIGRSAYRSSSVSVFAVRMPLLCRHARTGMMPPTSCV